jgi:hypothetical protein
MRRPHRLRAGTKNLAPKNFKGKIWDYRTTDYKTATESIGKSAGQQIGRSGRQRIANGEWRMANSKFLTTHPRWVATKSKQAKAC